MFELWSATEVCAHSGPVVDWRGNELALPAADPECSDRIIDFFERLAMAGDGFRWAVREVSGGEFVGAAGFNHLGDPAELAFHQVPRFWGRGLMHEACLAGVTWIQEQGTREVVAFIEPGNTRSVRLVERLGFSGSDEIREGARCHVLSRNAD